tara:strand:- start:220 stop:444 length:225 start_codon:yes stop_codon:yes gene_type:complete
MLSFKTHALSDVLHPCPVQPHHICLIVIIFLLRQTIVVVLLGVGQQDALHKSPRKEKHVEDSWLQDIPIHVLMD